MARFIYLNGSNIHETNGFKFCLFVLTILNEGAYLTY